VEDNLKTTIYCTARNSRSLGIADTPYMLGSMIWEAIQKAITGTRGSPEGSKVEINSHNTSGSL